MLDFDQVQQALESLGSKVDAAESHGTICGLLVGNNSLQAWYSHTLEKMPDKADVLAEEAVDILEELFVLTDEQFNSEDLAFELLLPDDSDDFGLRLLGLSHWCQGFLYGVGVLGAKAGQLDDTEPQECLADLLEISKLSHTEEPSEEAEMQFFEIVEHVRISAMTIKASWYPVEELSDQPAESSTQLH